MLKKLVHYFTSRSLDKHLQKTQCMIDEYEREAAASQARVQAQADAYKLQIQQLAKLREDQLKQYVEFLNDHIEKTTDYIDHLKDLPQAMFLCVEAWLRRNISELRWNLERDKTQVIRSTISYLDELNQEMIRLSRAQERRTWQAQIANRPPRVTTPEITKLVKQFARDAKSDAKDYERDLSRIKSYQSKLRKQLSDLRISTSGLKAEKERNSEQHQLVRQRVKALYEQCGTKFRALQDIFENYYQFSDSDSPLANLWISQMPNGGTLREINQVLIDTRPDWEDAKRRTSDLKHRRTIIQTRIKWAHDFKEFSTLDADKEARSEIVHSLADAREHQDNFFKARQVFTSRRDEIKKLMGWINDLHPSKTIEQVFTLLSRDDTDIYWPAIGLATKSVRHPARRQQ